MGVGFGIRIRPNLNQRIRYSAEPQKSGFGASLHFSLKADLGFSVFEKNRHMGTPSSTWNALGEPDVNLLNFLTISRNFR